MYKRTRNSFAFLIFLLFLIVPLTTLAQQTTSSMRVNVATPDGMPSTDATVSVTDTRTGSTKTSTVTSAGSVTFAGLRIGGPYTVKANAMGYSDQTVTDVFVRLGDTFVLPMTLGLNDMEEVVVTSAAVMTQQVAPFLRIAATCYWYASCFL